MSDKKRYVPKVTMGWDMHPSIQLEDGRIYPRSVEFIFHDKYYPKKEAGEWPIDPATGERLLMADRD